MTDTPNLGLPLISEGLANERIVHNQALGILDAITGNSVIAKDTLAQPVSPAEGDTYIIDGTGTGAAWSGQDDNVAFFLGGIWNFLVPVEGLFFFVRDIDERVEWDGAVWGPFSVSVVGLLTEYAESGKAQNATRSTPFGTSSAQHTLVLPTSSENYLVTGRLKMYARAIGVTNQNTGAEARFLVNGTERGNNKIVVESGTGFPAGQEIRDSSGPSFAVVAQHNEIIRAEAIITPLTPTSGTIEAHCSFDIETYSLMLTP